MKVTLMFAMCTLVVLLQVAMAQFNDMLDASRVSPCKI